MTAAAAAPAALLPAVFVDAVARLDPAARVAAALARLAAGGDDVAARLGRGPVVVIAVGKAACAMARGAAALAGQGARGLVVAPAAGAAPWPVMVASHPVPDAASEAAGRALMAMVRGAPAAGVVVALISGGASALAAVPADGVTLAEKVARVRAAMARGAPIAELNRLRASLSAVKGGRLAAMCAAPVVTLVASDVVGDDPRVVGSGPTIDLRPGAPAGSRAIVVAGIADLARAAVDAAAARGVAAEVIDAAAGGDVADVAARLAAAAVAAPGVGARGPALRVFAGEPTVRLPDSPGTGGRACQLALLAARAIAGRADAAILCAGSDGVDGTGPAAGAVVDGDTWARLAAAGVDAAAALARCDAGAALARIGATVVTGPTGVNHADLMLVWRGPA